MKKPLSSSIVELVRVSKLHCALIKITLQIANIAYY